MKTIYLECNMGAAGDMLTAALLELHPDPEAFVERINAFGLPGVEVSADPSVKCGITGTHVSVTIGGAEEASLDVAHDAHTYEHGHHDHHDHNHKHGHEHEHNHHEHEHGHDHHDHPHEDHDHDHDHHDHGHAHDHEHEHDHGHEHPHVHSHEHSHSGMEEINRRLASLDLPKKVASDVSAVYALIADAESRVHGRPVEQVHFHEVGALDAFADILAVSLLFHELAPDRVLASPVHVGSGQVRCAHGILPVPAPATALILEGIPIYSGQIRGELCTPTGAALLRHFAAAFVPMPVMRVERIGYGMGKKDFPAANCVRAFLGETDEVDDEVDEIACNLDDMTPESLAFAVEQLMDAGALDVTTTSIGMKKGRPGILLSCMCNRDRTEAITSALFRHTSTLGVRVSTARRSVLRRESRTVDTAYGPVRVKTASGWGVTREKPEYEDLARIARERDLPLETVRQAAEAAMRDEK